jgi:hypothetical protein
MGNRTFWDIKPILVVVMIGACSPIAHTYGRSEAENLAIDQFCLGQFCLHNTSPRILKTSDLISRYGSGHKIDGKFPIYCFKSTASGTESVTYVRFSAGHAQHDDVVEMFVSDAPNCPAVERPATSFGDLRTERGLKLGDSYENVMSLYGKPDATRPANGIEQLGLPYEEQVRTIPFGDTMLIYWPDKNQSLHINIYMRERKVAGMLISRVQ